jgi:hypothetical protein
MKSNIKISIVLFVLILSSVFVSERVSAQQYDVSYQVFYDQLSPYGQWVEYPNYGYVWIPDFGPDFVPYSTNGHWMYSDYGWTWVSDYSWGWAPFHYGRWDFDNYYGWFWIPDNEWGPAWVSWRRADGYYGWEPMGPGITISVSFGRDYDRNHDHWIFVRDRDFDRSDINRYSVNRSDHDRIIRNSTVINNTYVDNRRNTTYVTGPGRDDIQRGTGRRVNTVSIQENNKPGQEMNNGQLRIYRPQMVKNNDREQKPAPSRLTNLKDVKQPSERKVVSQPGNVKPVENIKQERQQGKISPQNGNNSKSLQQKDIKPVQNNRREVQKEIVKPQNDNNAKPLQQPDPQPAQKSRREVKQATVVPQNVNNVKPSDQKSAKPSRNTGTVRQQKVATPPKATRNEQTKNAKTVKEIKKND